MMIPICQTYFVYVMLHPSFNCFELMILNFLNLICQIENGIDGLFTDISFVRLLDFEGGEPEDASREFLMEAFEDEIYKSLSANRMGGWYIYMATKSISWSVI